MGVRRTGLKSHLQTCKTWNPMTTPSGILNNGRRRKKKERLIPKIVAYLSLLRWSHALRLDQWLCVCICASCGDKAGASSNLCSKIIPCFREKAMHSQKRCMVYMRKVEWPITSSIQSDILDPQLSMLPGCLLIIVWWSINWGNQITASSW